MRGSSLSSRIVTYMTRTIVIANQKGGIGKSTTVANLGRALSEKGKRVLMVDLDPQGGLSASLGVDSFNVKRSTFSLLMYNTVQMSRVVRPIAQYIALAPSSIDLSNAEIMLATQADGVTRLKDALQTRNRIDFDFVLIDTPPTLGILTANGMVAADELILPVQCQFLAMRGVRSVLDTMERLKTNGVNPNLRLAGVLPTMYHPNSQTSQEAVEEMRDVFGEKLFKTIIYFDEVVADAPAAGESLIDYASNHPVAHAYRQFAEEVIANG